MAKARAGQGTARILWRSNGLAALDLSVGGSMVHPTRLFLVQTYRGGSMDSLFKLRSVSWGLTAAPPLILNPAAAHLTLTITLQL